MAFGGEEFHAGFWWENPVGKRLLRRPWSRRKDNIEMYFRSGIVTWAGLIWLRKGRSGGFL